MIIEFSANFLPYFECVLFRERVLDEHWASRWGTTKKFASREKERKKKCEKKVLVLGRWFVLCWLLLCCSSSIFIARIACECYMWFAIISTRDFFVVCSLKENAKLMAISWMQSVWKVNSIWSKSEISKGAIVCI